MVDPSCKENERLFSGLGEREEKIGRSKGRYRVDRNGQRPLSDSI